MGSSSYSVALGCSFQSGKFIWVHNTLDHLKSKNFVTVIVKQNFIVTAVKLRSSSNPCIKEFGLALSMFPDKLVVMECFGVISCQGLINRRVFYSLLSLSFTVSDDYLS